MPHLWIRANAGSLTPRTSVAGSSMPTSSQASAQTILDETLPSSLEAPLVTASPVLRQKLDGNPYYITLTVENPTTTYTTTVLLGDSYPASVFILSVFSLPEFNVKLTPLPVASKPAVVSKPGLTTADIIGIVIGVVGGVSVLIGVMYVYFLRLRMLGRTKVRRRRRNKGSSHSGKYCQISSCPQFDRM